MVFPDSPGILEEKLEDNKNVFSIDVCPDFFCICRCFCTARTGNFKFQAGNGQTSIE